MLVEVTSHGIDFQGCRARLVLAHDVTTQYESEERFRQVVENIREVFWMSDIVKRQILYVSPGYEAVWGRSCASLYANPRMWLETIHPDDRDRVFKASETKQVSGDYDETYRITRSDGTVRWIRDRAFPVRDAMGSVYRIVGTAEDITDYRKLEEQLRQSHKMEAIGTLAGGIAHDFSNILAAIIGNAELAQLDSAGNPVSLEHLGDILKAARRATDLVRQILAFSRQDPQERRPIRLQPVIAESLKLLRATLPATIEFETSLAADAPVVLADSTQVHQILMNLGTNAWHAMKDRTGRLQVTLARHEVEGGSAATQGSLRPGIYARLSVSDTGCGITPAIQRRIFEPLFLQQNRRARARVSVWPLCTESWPAMMER